MTERHDDASAERPGPVGAATVAAVLAGEADEVREHLERLRQLILETAEETDGVGPIEETLRWGQPSYLTSETKSGSTIRIAPANPASGYDYGLFFICRTDLVPTIRRRFDGTLPPRSGGTRPVHESRCHERRYQRIRSGSGSMP